MSRTIDVTLNLKDNLSKALKATTDSASNRLKGLQNQANQAGKSQGAGGSGGVSVGTIAAGNLLAGAISGIASGVASAGASLVGAIGSAYEKAAEANRGALGATSANAALLGMGFEESAKLTSSITAQLAKSAETLPGATKDYLDAFNGVSDTLSLSGGLTKKGMTDAGREMVELVAMLGKASGSGSGSTSTAIGKMLGDSGSEALFRIDAFEKVPAFKAILEKDLEKSGKTLGDFFKMDAAAKQAQLVEVKKKLFSKDYVSAMNESMDAQMDTLGAKIFDPTSGVLGFLRGIKIDGKDTSVFGELGKTFKAITEASGAFMGLFSGGQDPMVSLANAIIGVRLWAESAKSFIEGATAKAGIGGLVSSIMSNLGAGITSTLKSVTDFLMSGSMGSLGVQAGVILGQGIQQVIGLNIQGLMWVAESGLIGVLGAGIYGVGQFLVGALFGLLSQLPGIIYSALESGLNLVAVGLLAVFTAGVALIGAAISGTWISVVAGFTSIGEAASGALAGIAAGAVGYFSGVIEAIKGLGSAISGAIEGAKKAVGSFVSGAIDGAKNAVSGMVSGKSRYSGQGLGLVHSNMFSGSGQYGKVHSAYNGNMLDAMKTESARMPSGASLVVANSSELIVPRNRISEIMGGNQINLTINAQRGKIIEDTVAALNNALRQPALSMV